MAPLPAKQKKYLGKVLVIGGCGFLGHHIVDLILESYNSDVSVIDLRTTRNRRPDSDGVQYFDADITDLSSILPIFEKIKPDVVIHTASPAAIGEESEKKAKLRNEMYTKVNVGGTECVIEACQKANVKALVYTSSASVISDTETDLINADERWPVIPAKNQKEYYSTTKVHFLPLSTQYISSILNPQPGSSRSRRPRRKPLPHAPLPAHNRHPPRRHLRRRRRATHSRRPCRLHHRQNKFPTRRERELV